MIPECARPAKTPKFLTGTETIPEVRKLIHEMARTIPLVRQVLDIARINKLSEEHAMLLLAHAALASHDYLFERYTDLINLSPMPAFTIPALMALIPDKQAVKTGVVWHWWNHTVTETECGLPRTNLRITHDKKRVTCMACREVMRTYPDRDPNPVARETVVKIVAKPDPGSPAHQFLTSSSHGSPDVAKRWAEASCSCGATFEVQGENAGLRVYLAWEAHATELKPLTEAP